MPLGADFRSWDLADLDLISDRGLDAKAVGVTLHLIDQMHGLRNALPKMSLPARARKQSVQAPSEVKNILGLAIKRLIVDPGDALQLAEKQSARTVSWWEVASPLQAIENVIVELGELACTHCPSAEASFQHRLLEDDRWQRMTGVLRNSAEGLLDRIRLPLQRLGKEGVVENQQSSDVCARVEMLRLSKDAANSRV